MSFTYSLGGRDTVNLAARGGDLSAPGAPPNQALGTFSHSPPIGPGSGYRLSTSTAGDYDADWRQQFSDGDLEFEVARNQGFAGQSALADGTLTFMGGSLYASRAMPGSFAVVNVAGLPDVGVYVENQLVARTNDSGQAVLPNLLPYVANRISIDPTQLPLDTVIDARQAVVAPPFMSGVLVNDNASPVPPGASVDFNGESFPVALDGLVYVTGYDRAQAGRAHWAGHVCRFHLGDPPAHDPLPDMGTIQCEEEAATR
jgi:outer membrane usher protein